MIPCTEFIPAYSELFTFLENKKGREEVDPSVKGFRDFFLLREYLPVSVSQLKNLCFYICVANIRIVSWHNDPH